MRELTAYEERCLDHVEAETKREQKIAAAAECKLVLTGMQDHVLLCRSNPTRDGLYDAGELWELIADRHDDAEMSVLAGALFDPDANRKAFNLVNEVINDLAEEHSEASAMRAVSRAASEITGVEA